MTTPQITAFVLNSAYNDYDYYITSIVQELRRKSLIGQVDKDTLLNTIDLLRSEIEDKIK